MSVYLCGIGGTSAAEAAKQQAQTDIAALLRIPSSEISERTKKRLGLGEPSLGTRVKSLLGRVDRFLFPKDFSTKEKIVAVAAVLLVGVVLGLNPYGAAIILGAVASGVVYGVGLCGYKYYKSRQEQEFQNIMEEAHKANGGK